MSDQNTPHNEQLDLTNGDLANLKKATGSFDVNDVKDRISDELRILVDTAKENGLIERVEELLKSNDKFKKAYEQYWADNSEADAILSLWMAQQENTDRVEDYKFPYDRTSPAVLRRAARSIAGQMILSYRSYQLAEFSQPSDGKKPGFQLVTSDPDRELSEKEKKDLAQWEQTFSKKIFHVREGMQVKPSLFRFLTQSYEDYMTLDKIAMEVVRTNFSFNKDKKYSGKPLGLFLTDAGLIHRILPEQDLSQQVEYQWQNIRHDAKEQKRKQGLLPGQKKNDFIYRDDFRYVMVDELGELRQLFLSDQMILSSAHASTRYDEHGQGMSIIEKGIQVLRYIIDSVKYNYTRRSFQVQPKGILSVEGGDKASSALQREVNYLRKTIYGMLASSEQQWKIPIMGMPSKYKLNFTRLHESSKEMEDFLWLSTLFSWLCTFAGVDPENVAMASNKNAVGKQRLFDRTEEGAMLRSEDHGLRFFLSYFENILNDPTAANGEESFVEEITGMEGILFRFAGLDVEDESKKLEIKEKQLKTDTSRNELLALEDKKAIDEESFYVGGVNVFDIPGLSSETFGQLILKVQQEEQQEKAHERQMEQQSMFGGFGGGFGGPGGAPGGEASGGENEYEPYLANEEPDNEPAPAEMNKSRTSRGKQAAIYIQIEDEDE